MSGASGTTARALIVLVVVFVAGGAAGVALDRAWWRGSEPPTHETRRAGVAEDQIPVPLLQLGLSPDEQTRLHAIAREWRPRAAAEMTDVRAKVGQLENGMFADMLCAITPEHRDRYLDVVRQEHLPAEQIDIRFALVRANRCPAK